MKSSPWIVLLAYEAAVRRAADCHQEDGIARRLALVRLRVLDDLRCAIASDIEGFLCAGDDRSGVGLTCRSGSSDQGFVVFRMNGRIGTRTLAVDLRADTLRCRYDMSGGSVSAASNERAVAIEIGNDGSALSLWDSGLQRTFATLDVLSAFLLAPILGGDSGATSGRS